MKDVGFVVVFAMHVDPFVHQEMNFLNQFVFLVFAQVEQSVYSAVVPAVGISSRFEQHLNYVG